MYDNPYSHIKWHEEDRLANLEETMLNYIALDTKHDELLLKIKQHSYDYTRSRYKVISKLLHRLSGRLMVYDKPAYYKYLECLNYILDNNQFELQHLLKEIAIYTKVTSVWKYNKKNVELVLDYLVKIRPEFKAYYTLIKFDVL